MEDQERTHVGTTGGVEVTTLGGLGGNGRKDGKERKGGAPRQRKSLGGGCLGLYALQGSSSGEDLRRCRGDYAAAAQYGSGILAV